MYDKIYDNLMLIANIPVSNNFRTKLNGHLKAGIRKASLFTRDKTGLALTLTGLKFRTRFLKNISKPINKTFWVSHFRVISHKRFAILL